MARRKRPCGSPESPAFTSTRAAIPGTPAPSIRTRILSPVCRGVITRPWSRPNGTTLPFKIVDGVKVFHLIPYEITHEFAPGLKAIVWGYNGETPGPVIEAVEGDHIRIYVSNKLPVPTSVHWHGLLLPCNMDGVSGLTQRPIRAGETFVYEFKAVQHGTFMYHSHKDTMTQEGMGLTGMFVIHPRRPKHERPDRDFSSHAS